MSIELIRIYQRRIGCSIEELAQECREIVKEQAGVVEYRVKDENALARKMRHKGVQSVFSIDDVFGIRILVDSEAAVYAAFEKICHRFTVHLDHDYIARPKTRPDKPELAGYSFRTVQIIAYLNRAPFEIQLTTHEYNRMNEVLHDGYRRSRYREDI